jgi:hypothetical protein
MWALRHFFHPKTHSSLVNGRNNNLTVLDQSPLVANFFQGLGNDVNFIVNQRVMNVSLYLLMGFIQGGQSLFK